MVISLVAAAGSKSRQPVDRDEVDLSAAASPNDTVVASARSVTKFAIAALTLGTLVLASWDGFLRQSPERLRAAIWGLASIGLGAYLVKLFRQRVIFSPSGISWIDGGEEVAKKYSEVRDFRVVSRSELHILFADGRKLAITSDMTDLRKALATITSRRLASGAL
jgi:hypothetical protein